MLRSTQRKAVVAMAAVTLTGSFGVLAAQAAPAPTGVAITGLSVVKGATTATTNLLVNGTGFNSFTELGVKFGENPSTKVIVLSDTQVAVVAPTGAAGPVNVTLTDKKSADTTVEYDAPANYTKDDFTYLVPFNATVAEGSLMNSLGGSKLTVTSSAPVGICGTDFTNNKVTATVGGVAAQVACSTTSATTVTLTVPAGAVSTASTSAPKVVLFHDGVPGTPSTDAKYAAVIGTIDKPVGPVTPVTGSTIAITGKGFKNATAWNFGGKTVTCTPTTTVPADADTKVTCPVPAQDADFKGGAVTVSFTPDDDAVFGATSKATYTYSDLG
jgi:hypothetical protein